MITEEDGKLVRRTELSTLEIELEIKELKDSVKETTDKIEMFESYLPDEELEVETETTEESEDTDTPNY